MGKVLCIGEALIDMICTDKGKPLQEGEQFLKKPGGAPTNVAAAIAALGGEVELAAKVGADPFGKHLQQVMQSFGVGTRWMLEDEKLFTTFAFVSLMEDGERDFYFNRGADGQLQWEELKEIVLRDFAIIHFGSATGFLPGPLQETYRQLLEKAKEENIFISFDPNYRQLLFQHQQQTFIEQSWNFIHHCDFFKVSDEEAMMLTGAGSVTEAAGIFLDKTRAVFAITLGKEGTLIGIRGELEIVTSIPVQAVDTTGAGDAFVGAVLYQLSFFSREEIQSLSKEKWNEIIFRANKAGARTCEYMGAMEAFRHLNNDIFN
jgi:fructokinase